MAASTLVAGSPVTAQVQPPAVDHHQHLFSPATATLSPGVKAVAADDLVELLDAAGIRRAVVLSLAYQFGNPNRPAVADEYAKVRAENTWVSDQIGRAPERIVGLCSVNPLKDYAKTEIARCASELRLKKGLKLHFGNSDIELHNASHVAKVREAFAAANTRRMAIVVHMRPSVTRQRPYGAAQARMFLEQLLPAAPDVTVQIAHLAGAGGYDDPAIDQALSVFVDAIARRDVRMKNVVFDVSGVAGLGQWHAKADLIARRIRQLGVSRILYGSDAAPSEALTAFRRLPLSDEEFRTIAGNAAPYLR